jgi:peptidoglycan/LPS O-acetylase OafA/YrhL
LDGIRAVAIGLVFAEHFGGFIPGTLGVDVFFVLSGYLITGLLLTEFDRRDAVSFRSFYRRRALRLMPAYFTVVAATVAAVLTIGSAANETILGKGLATSLTYTSNVASAAGRWDSESPRLWEFTWSLSAEEQFYLVWPVLLVGGLRLARTARARVWLGALPFAGFAASVLWTHHLMAAHVPVMRVAVAPDTRSGGLLLGCAIAIWESVWRRREHPPARVVAAIQAAGILLGVAVLWMYADGDGYSQARSSPLICVATGLLIIGVAADLAGHRRSLVTRALATRPMALLGRLSYSLYLYNVLALLAFEYLERRAGLQLEPVLRPLIAALIALGLAWGSYRYVEQPFLRLRERARRPAVS